MNPTLEILAAGACCAALFLALFVLARRTERRSWGPADRVVVAWGAMFPLAALFLAWVVPLEDGVTLASLISAALLGFAFQHWSVALFVMLAYTITMMLTAADEKNGSVLLPPLAWNLGWSIPTLVRSAVLRSLPPRMPGACSACGYDRTGLPGGACCPECGDAAPDGLSSARSR